MINLYRALQLISVCRSNIKCLLFQRLILFLENICVNVGCFEQNSPSFENSVVILSFLFLHGI